MSNHGKRNIDMENIEEKHDVRMAMLPALKPALPPCMMHRCSEVTDTEIGPRSSEDPSGRLG